MAATGAASKAQYFLVTLNRSPLHLPKRVKRTCDVIGLNHRLASSIIPVSQQNAGFITRIKELVSVRTLSEDELARIASEKWATRPGQGRTGSGLRTVNGAVIRVGSERARGDERGYRISSQST